jgi:hypothetical protein
MANLLQSSQTKETIIPDAQKSALCSVAKQVGTCLAKGKYIGATGLQNQAFKNAAANAGIANPDLNASANTLNTAAGTNISGAAKPYLNQALNTNPAQLAQCYMSPYIKNAVQGMSNVAMRNMQQNLDPQATAASVGSGQFGSQRGAQVLGQINANAMNDLNSQIATMENTGYGNALQAATARQNLLNNMGSTAANAASSCAQAKNTAGANLTNLGKTRSCVNIACNEELAKLGAECQTIQQNAQCYGLSRACKAAKVLSSLNVPTKTKTTLCMSPLSAAGAIGSAGMGVLNCYCKIKKGVKNIFGDFGGANTGGGNTGQDSSFGGAYGGSGGSNAPEFSYCCVDFASGGLVPNKNVGGAMGCASLRNLGALPCRR